MNLFSDLYQARGWGDWMSDHQGLSVGMDLLDWMRFVRRAAEVICLDTDAERRILKLHRLQLKALKVVNPCWTIGKTPLLIRKLIVEAEWEIQARSSARLNQLSLWIEAVK